MPYRYAREQADYSAFASGHVLHSVPGHTGFPARLASEVFQRCAARLGDMARPGPHTLYDPCCGGAHLLTTLAFLHGEEIGTVLGSDDDAGAIRLAERNLALLTPAGLDARVAALRELWDQYGKATHAQAVTTALALRDRLDEFGRSPAFTIGLFQADATRPEEIRRQVPQPVVDVVITDLPYGHGTSWASNPDKPDRDDSARPPSWWLLESLRPVLAASAVVAVVANKAQVVGHDAFRRVERLKIGKRRADFFVPV
jgi:tRNA G10  N-methylase Trm11